MDNDTYEQLIAQFENIIYATFHELDIRSYHKNYDESLQLARIILMDTYQFFQGDPFSDEGRYLFAACFRKKLRWRLLNQFRNEHRHTQHVLYTDTYPETIEDTNILTNILTDELLTTLTDLLTEEEKNVLYLLLDQCPITQIAKKLHVTRKTIYRIRKRIATKLSPCLTHEHQKA